MNGKQIKTVFDELEASNPLEQARVWLKASDSDGATMSIIVDSGGYDLFMEDKLLVTRYDYVEGDVTMFTRTPDVRHVGANFVPFDSILLVELMADGSQS